MVEEALDSIPEDLAAAIDNVVVVVEGEPSPQLMREMGLDPASDTLFGLYEGVALTERGDSWYGGTLPDRIVIYRRPLVEYCTSRRQLVSEIRDTVVHELGHYFGLEEEDLP